MKHHSRPFIFSASITPSSTAVALASLRHLEEHPELPERLRAIAAYAAKGMDDRGIRHGGNPEIPIIPIYTSTLEKTLLIGKTLFEKGVYVNPVLPPATPPEDCLLRTSYMATHSESEIDEALDVIKSVLDELL